jgi:putative aldouronate transport system substrate-binding protein
MVKKIVLMTVILSMMMSIVGCGGGASTGNNTNDSSTNSETDNKDSSNKGESYETVVYSYATFNNIPSNDALSSVEEEINKITRERIGVEVELMPINITEYGQKVSLALQGGEQIDIFESLGDFNTSVSAKMAYDITELVDQYAVETKELIGEEILAAVTKEGSLYGIPTYKPYALTPMVIYKQEIADELNLDMSQVKSIEDLTDVLRTVKDAYPDMTPLVPVSPGDSGIYRTVEEIDFLSDDYLSPKGVLQGDSLTVVDFYALPEFMEKAGLARQWYQENLILQDAATTTSTAQELMASNNSFCYIASYSYPEEDTAASLSSQMGTKVGAKRIGEAYLDTSSISALTWMVSSMSDVPEAAVKFLNLTFTDPDVVNLLIYGIEGRDYVLDENGQALYPEGEDATTVPYTAQISVGTLGNFFIMHPSQGTNEESLAWEQEQNQIAKKSPAMGFTFDSSAVKTEYTAVSNVINQYLAVISTGSVDPVTAVPDFIEKLDSAGMNAIIAEKQGQLDQWLENKE